MEVQRGSRGVPEVSKRHARVFFRVRRSIEKWIGLVQMAKHTAYTEVRGLISKSIRTDVIVDEADPGKRRRCTSIRRGGKEDIRADAEFDLRCWLGGAVIESG